MLQYLVCTYFVNFASATTSQKKRSQQLKLILWEWFLMGMVIMSQHTIDVELMLGSRPCSSNGYFCSRM